MFINEIEYCEVQALEITTRDEIITSVNGQTTPTELEGLSVFFKPVNYLPKGIGTFFPKLKELLFDDCNIQSIEADDLKNMSQLESLQLFNNSIEELPSDLFKFTPKLRHINFGKNKIYSVGRNLLANFTTLETHFFDRNPCADFKIRDKLSTIIDRLIENCPEIAPAEVKCKVHESDCDVELLMIEVRRTKLAMQQDGQIVKNFIILHQKTIFLPFKMFAILPNLEKFAVVDSKLSELQQNDFKGLTKLDEIKIERNNISLIEKGVFDEIPQLKNLHLANNNIKSLPENVFAKLTRLEILNLTANKIAIFSANFLPTRPAIKEIYLQHNELEIIDAKIIKLLRRVDLIDLKNNPCIDILFRKITADKSLKNIYDDVDFQCSEFSEKET